MLSTAMVARVGVRAKMHQAAHTERVLHPLERFAQGLFLLAIRESVLRLVGLYVSLSAECAPGGRSIALCEPL